MRTAKTEMEKKAAINVHELAAMLGISVPRAYDLTKRVGFPAIRVSERRIIIPTEALRRWLNDQAGVPRREPASGGGSPENMG